MFWMFCVRYAINLNTDITCLSLSGRETKPTETSCLIFCFPCKQSINVMLSFSAI